MLLTYAGQPIQPMQKALTQMNIQLPHGVSALTGVTGMAIIRAILAGERAPVTLARLRDYRCQHSEETLAKALYGQGREEHLFALAQAVALYEVSHQKMTECDRQIAAHLGTFAENSGRQAPPARPKRKPKRKRHQPAFDVRGSLQRVPGVDLTTIEGIDDTTAFIVIREVGLDMSRWPTVKHCTSWLGLWPHQRVSGGKVLSRRTKSCANRVATALRLGAACLHHSQSAFGAFFRRMKARRGAPKAITATAHT
jgi:transposase